MATLAVLPDRLHTLNSKNPGSSAAAPDAGGGDAAAAVFVEEAAGEHALAGLVLVTQWPALLSSSQKSWQLSSQIRQARLETVFHRAQILAGPARTEFLVQILGRRRTRTSRAGGGDRHPQQCARQLRSSHSVP